MVFPAGDSGALAVALDQMRSDVALRQRLATSGRLAVLEQFDWSTAVHRYNVLYRQLEVNGRWRSLRMVFRGIFGIKARTSTSCGACVVLRTPELLWFAGEKCTTTTPWVGGAGVQMMLSEGIKWWAR